MKTLYTKDGVISKLWEQIRPLFSDAVQPTQKHLFDLLLAVLALDGFQSIKFCFEHFIQNISDFHLKSYYYTLAQGRISLEHWMEQLLRKTLSIVPDDLQKQAVILSIDDTMAEKSGEKFECCTKLFYLSGCNPAHTSSHGCSIYSQNIPFKQLQRQGNRRLSSNRGKSWQRVIVKPVKSFTIDKKSFDLG